MHRKSALIPLLVLAAAGLPALGTGLLADGAPAAVVVIPGTITSISPDGLVIRVQNGSVRVRTTAQTRVQRRVRAKVEDIQVGDFVGAAARKEANGSLTAVFINIFEGGLRSQIRQGQSTMESGDVMTNAIVTSYVSAISGRTMSVAYEGRTAQIIVPPTAQITRMFVTTRADLKVGRTVSVRGTQDADGSVSASSITIDPQ
jgi:hypothetical protein